MFYRRKVLLSLLKELDRPVNLVELQKLLFLVCFEQVKPRTYEFIPDKYGCYSFTIHSDQKILTDQGYLTCIPNSQNKIYSEIHLNETAINGVDIDLKQVDKVIVSKIASKYRKVTTRELIDVVYNLRPLYTINSEWLTQFTPDKDFQKSFQNVVERINAAPHALYTIGYEGLGIEGFIQKLILKNIKLVIDVRKNPISMKRDFSKSRLMKYLGEVGISYVHIPEVGITTEKRKEYLAENRRTELFTWYEENTLHNCGDSIERIHGLCAEQNVVLLCYEKNPEDCHRSHLADSCHKNFIDMDIKHIV